jgi:hypothetical protein
MGIYKFGNKSLLSAYKTQFEFRSHFSGEKMRLIGWEIQQYIMKLRNYTEDLGVERRALLK